MKKLASLQPFFIPWLGVFNQIKSVDIFAIADNLQYAKGSWINRNRIKNLNGGFTWLTVPLQAADSTAKINERRIDKHQKWIDIHLKSLEFNYRTSPYFPHYFPIVKRIYQNEHELILDLNLDFIKFFLDELNIKTQIILESSYSLPMEKNSAIIDLCKKNDANIYFSGPSADNYLDYVLFEKNHIKVILQSCVDIEYPQIGKADFEKKLSIIDTLFMVGPELTRQYIDQIDNSRIQSS